MQPMIGTETPFGLSARHRFDHRVKTIEPIAATPDVTDRHGIKDGGDAGDSHLRIMCDDRGRRRPMHARAGRCRAFEIIRMQLDEAGQQIIAFKIDNARCGARAAGRLHFDDAAGAGKKIAKEDSVPGDDLGIGM